MGIKVFKYLHISWTMFFSHSCSLFGANEYMCVYYLPVSACTNKVMCFFSLSLSQTFKQCFDFKLSWFSIIRLFFSFFEVESRKSHALTKFQWTKISALKTKSEKRLCFVHDLLIDRFVALNEFDLLMAIKMLKLLSRHVSCLNFVERLREKKSYNTETNEKKNFAISKTEATTTTNVFHQKSLEKKEWNRNECAHTGRKM